MACLNALELEEREDINNSNQSFSRSRPVVWIEVVLVGVRVVDEIVLVVEEEVVGLMSQSQMKHHHVDTWSICSTFLKSTNVKTKEKNTKQSAASLSCFDYDQNDADDDRNGAYENDHDDSFVQML